MPRSRLEEKMVRRKVDYAPYHLFLKAEKVVEAYPPYHLLLTADAP
ncbi:MAG: hypothetical protein GY820_40345 [Gammaproteobacteria bacterium]|nr:hypothetical protein [Gammaproteobacteria bacterium]